MRLLKRSHDDTGAVLIVVALTMLILITASSGGIMLFTLYGTHRELQKAADQAAVAGAAALPPLYPGQALDSLPAGSLDTAYDLAESVGANVPLLSQLVPDPRAVACAYGHHSLSTESAPLIGEFGAPPATTPATFCANAPWADARIVPALGPSPLLSCIESLNDRLAVLRNEVLNQLGLLSLVDILLAGFASAQEAADAVMAPLEEVARDLGQLSPALLKPTMTVGVQSGVQPPLMTVITGRDGIDMHLPATAERRLKNAVVIPVAPNTPVTSISDLNPLLADTRDPILANLSALNDNLNLLLGSGGLNVSDCNNLLQPLVTDAGDIYNPPASGQAPTALSLIEKSVAATERAAADAGTTVDKLAGEAYYVIGAGPQTTTLPNILGTAIDTLGLTDLVGSLQIPALDVAVVAAHNLEDGNISNPDLIPDTVQARGLFRASLIE